MLKNRHNARTHTLTQWAHDILLRTLCSIEIEISLDSLDISPDTFDADDDTKRPHGWLTAKQQRLKARELKWRKSGKQEWEILKERAALEAEVRGCGI